MILRIARRFPHAIRGAFYALRHDFSFRSQVCISALLIVATWYFCKPLSQTEILFLALAALLMLITELQNTAFEAALDRLHPERHDDIGRSKDMAAGSVLLASGFFLFVIVTIALL